jgi:hypothetical protein
MAYLVEFVLADNPDKMRATVVSKGFACTSDELFRELARATARQVGKSMYVLGYAVYDDVEAAREVANHIYPRPTPSKYKLLTEKTECPSNA